MTEAIKVFMGIIFIALLVSTCVIQTSQIPSNKPKVEVGGKP